MLSGPLRIYKDYQIVPKSTLPDEATNAIKFYFEDFSESIRYDCAHEDNFLIP